RASSWFWRTWDPPWSDAGLLLDPRAVRGDSGVQRRRGALAVVVAGAVRLADECPVATDPRDRRAAGVAVARRVGPVARDAHVVGCAAAGGTAAAGQDRQVDLLQRLRCRAAGPGRAAP